MISLSDNQVRLLHTRAQLLAGSPGSPTTIEGVVERVCGIQAQDYDAACLSVRVRSLGLKISDVEQAQGQERSVVRTWAFRGTLHLVATADLLWLMPLIGPHFARADARRRMELGLDEDTCARGMTEIRRLLHDKGPLPRSEIARHLSATGIPAEGQAMPHLLARAALEGMVVLAPERGGKPTYALLDDWLDLGGPLQERIRHASEEERDTAHAELVVRYLRAFGPATPDDMAAWSGLPMSKTRAAWERVAARLVEVRVSGGPAWILKEDAGGLNQVLHGATETTPRVRLLPSFDTYLLGYRSRQLAVDPRYARRVHPGGGMLSPTVIVDGRAVGTWRTDRKRLQVRVELFGPLDASAMAELEGEVQAIGQFLEIDRELQLRYEVLAQNGDAN